MLERRWQQWQQLAVWERVVLLGFVWRLPLVWALLHCLPLGKVMNWAARVPHPRRSSALPDGRSASDFARRCEQLATIAANHGIYRASCLPKALALQHLLGGHGLRTTLGIGVIPASRPLQAHAWVELGDEALGGPVSQYQRFTGLLGNGQLPL